MTAGEDMERRLHWLRLARELGQEDDFRALLDDVRQAPTREEIMTAILTAIYEEPESVTRQSIPQHEWELLSISADAVVALLGPKPATT